MLKFMRKSVKSIFIKALLVLLIASFAVWGIGDIFSGRSAVANVATIGETGISADQFKSELAREITRLQQTLGPDITREQAIAMGVGDMLMSRLVNSTILNAGAADMQLYISETAILNEIRNNKSFFNDAGVFDSRIFNQLLSNNGLSENSYVQYLRQGMERDQMLSAIASGAVPPKPLTDALYTFEAEKRVLDVLRINHAQIKNVPKPSTAELMAYHETNSQRFMAPQYKGLTAVVLDSADLAKTIDLTDADLQAAYDERADDYITPETRVLKQILVSDEAKAQDAAKMLDDGKALADVATQVKANPVMMNIGTMTRNEASALSADIGDAAFTAQKGAHTAPLKSPLGWHVIIVEDIIAGSVKPLEEVKDALSVDLKMTKALDQLFELSNQLEDLLGGGMTFEEAAVELGVTLVKTLGVDAQGLTPANTPAPLPFVADLLKQAAVLQAGGESPLAEDAESTAFFVVRVDTVTPPALRPFDTVQARVGQAWNNDKRTEMAAEIAKEAQTRLEAGEDVNQVAKSLGFSAFTTLPFTRSGQGLQQGAIPAEVIKQAFGLTQGRVAQAPGTGAHTVARVNTIEKAVMSDSDPLYESVTLQAINDLQNDLAQQMGEALQFRFPVRINQNVLNDIY